MSKTSSDLISSRRAFLGVGAAALVATSIGCNSQPKPEAPKTQPSEGAGTPPAAPAKPPTVISGTAPNTPLLREYVQMVGRYAYLWGWPMVNSFNRRTGLTSVPEPGLRGGILPNAPLGQVCMLTDYISSEQRFVPCSNSRRGLRFWVRLVDDNPIVYQVPDFGDRFWVYAAWDARTDSFAQLGKQYGTKPGFYLLVGPNWNGKTPDGISGTFRSPTELAALCPRVFMDDTAEDRQAILACAKPRDGVSAEPV